MNKRSVGSIYEQLAAEQLINMGYSVLACNYRNRFGEIDIIAKEGDTICFCEVKYRRDNGCGRALEAVGYSKQKKIISVARHYLTHSFASAPEFEKNTFFIPVRSQSIFARTAHGSV